jgi:hypothetical protein
MLWPQDLESKIVGLSLAKHLVPMVDDMKTTLRPVRGGSLENAFCLANERIPERRLEKRRAVRAPLPSILLPFYETYEDTTEFVRDNGLVFLSEVQVLRDSAEDTADFCFRYAGMGHVVLHTYVRKHDTVLSLLSGGANGYDRVHNEEARRKVVRQYVSDGTFSSQDRWSKCRPLETWWEEESTMIW